jgi:hypothetical protein
MRIHTLVAASLILCAAQAANVLKYPFPDIGATDANNWLFV